MCEYKVNVRNTLNFKKSRGAEAKLVLAETGDKEV